MKVLLLTTLKVYISNRYTMNMQSEDSSELSRKVGSLWAVV